LVRKTKKKKKYNYEDKWLYSVSGSQGMGDVDISNLIRLDIARRCKNPDCGNATKKEYLDKDGLCPNCWK